MALFLVTIVPIAIALLLSSRGLARKFLFGGCAILMVPGIGLTYSCGGFIGLLVALGFFAWKGGRRHRVEIVVARSSNQLLPPRFLDSAALLSIEFEGWLTGVSAALPRRRERKMDAA